MNITERVIIRLMGLWKDSEENIDLENLILELFKKRLESIKLASGKVYDYSPNQPRDKNGKWTNGLSEYAKPTGIITNRNGKKTLDKRERKRYDKILVGERTSEGYEVKSISSHAYDRAAQRELSPGNVRDVLKRPSQPSKTNDACVMYDGNKMRVVFDFKTGTIVTIAKRRSAK